MRIRVVLIALVVLLLLYMGQLTRLFTDFLWFDSLGLKAVFLTALSARLVLALGGALIFFLVLLVNYLVVRRNVPRYLVGPTDELIFFQDPRLQRYSGMIFLLAAVFFSVTAASALSAEWMTLLSWLNGGSFGREEPVFGRDVGFYVFSLPALWALWGFALGAVVVGALLSGAYYVVNGAIAFIQGARQFAPYVIRHLTALGGILLVLAGVAVILARYNLLYSAEGAVNGPGYTHVHATIPLLGVLAIGLIVLGIMVVARTWLPLGWGLRVATGIVAAVAVATLVYPIIVQQLRVLPNELALERPYLERNISFTRAAFGLDRVEELNYPASEDLDLEDIRRNDATIRNIRLWDWRPLLKTFGQLQEIRLYYSFQDVDVDRYEIGGEQQQVTLAARELSPDELPEKAQTWVNRHQVFLHGYGLVMNPVNRVTKEGLPLFYIKDIPPKPSVGLKVTRPEIYFGELTNEYGLVKTKTKEFDYPAGDRNVLTVYRGEDGVPISPALNRMAFSLRFSTSRILFSGSIKPESKILINRNIEERARALAPFLAFDPDPYLVLDSKGRIFWIIDAYTFTGRYPYSERTQGLNYIRNSVKTVIDAYNGTVRFYVIDKDDPLIATYRRIFPALFRPIGDMPEDLRAHLRYPVQLFRIQAETMATYHMRDPQVFYNREDQWDIPMELFGAEQQQVEPYYVNMKVPGRKKAEFILLLPFTPRNKNNMISWMWAGNDGSSYGQLAVFKFPKDRQLFGPSQIEARIDQDPVISQQLTLWNQSGSEVIRGNLLVIPIENSLMYVEPLYLKSTRSELPELTRVIVSFSEHVVMEPTLEEALRKIFGGPSAAPAPERPAEEAKPGEAPERVVPTAGIEALIKKAGDHFRAAQEKAKTGDWAGFGEEMKSLEESIGDLERGSRD